MKIRVTDFPIAFILEISRDELDPNVVQITAISPPQRHAHMA